VPLRAQVTTTGLQLSGASPTETPDHIVTPFIADITAGSAVSGLTVTGFGAFHVNLSVALAGDSTIEVTLVQGSPIVFLRFVNGPAQLSLGPGATATRIGSQLTVKAADRTWLLAATSAWSADAGQVQTDQPATVAIGLLPAGADPVAWTKLVTAAAVDPITDTVSTLAYDAGHQVSRQTLTVIRASGSAGPFVLLPHHQRAASAATKSAPAIGSFALPTGQGTVISASQVTLQFTSPDPVAKLATVKLAPATRTAILNAVQQDLADPPTSGGSYNDGKEMGRLATVAEVARVIGAASEQAAALARLKTKLVDWLTYTGTSDDRYFAYEPTWGGIVGIPNEFGSESYNDHHFHYGYHVRAAAILAESDPQFLTDYGSLVDLLVADYAGSPTIAGLPQQRVFQPYLGHSWASGLVPFADGNNQESSSEAIQAWHAMARWGAVRADPTMAEQGRAHYALETTTARLYWLGETTGVRPSKYAHTVVGILWDAKLDFATWFSAMPEAIFGIQLIPLNEGSAYRADAAAAQQRSNEVRSLAGGAPRMWGDLFAADLAVSDPVKARAALAANVAREPSTGRAITRYWIELQAAAH
jgi:endoglucanase Acf2